jgi:hypothetical protein
MANKTSSDGIGFGTVLFLVFLVLKLTGNIDWSWWWVTSPLWIPLALGAIILGVIGLIAVMLNKK